MNSRRGRWDRRWGSGPLCRGLVDLYAALASRRIGALRVVPASRVLAMLVLTALMLGLEGFAAVALLSMLAPIALVDTGGFAHFNLGAGTGKGHRGGPPPRRPTRWSRS